MGNAATCLSKKKKKKKKGHNNGERRQKRDRRRYVWLISWKTTSAWQSSYAGATRPRSSRPLRPYPRLQNPTATIRSDQSSLLAPHPSRHLMTVLHKVHNDQVVRWTRVTAQISARRRFGTMSEEKANKPRRYNNFNQ
jgi:hypothetical protein